MIFTFTWNVSTEGQPAQTDMIRDGAQAIRDRFQAIRERLAREHDMNLATTTEQGTHLAGSGKIYTGAGVPTGILRPNGEALTSSDVGRCYLNTTTGELYYYNGTTWIKSGDIADGVALTTAFKAALVAAYAGNTDTSVDNALTTILAHVVSLEAKIDSSVKKIEVV
jgi:hypothetical protein